MTTEPLTTNEIITILSGSLFNLPIEDRKRVIRAVNEHEALLAVAEIAVGISDSFKIVPLQNEQALSNSACGDKFVARCDKASIVHRPVPSPYRNNAYALKQQFELLETSLSALSAVRES